MIMFLFIWNFLIFYLWFRLWWLFNWTVKELSIVFIICGSKRYCCSSIFEQSYEKLSNPNKKEPILITIKWHLEWLKKFQWNGKILSCGNEYILLQKQWIQYIIVKMNKVHLKRKNNLYRSASSMVKWCCEGINMYRCMNIGISKKL